MNKNYFKGAACFAFSFFALSVSASNDQREQRKQVKFKSESFAREYMALLDAELLAIRPGRTVNLSDQAGERRIREETKRRFNMLKWQFHVMSLECNKLLLCFNKFIKENPSTLYFPFCYKIKKLKLLLKSFEQEYENKAFPCVRDSAFFLKEFLLLSAYVCNSIDWEIEKLCNQHIYYTFAKSIKFTKPAEDYFPTKIYNVFKMFCQDFCSTVFKYDLVNIFKYKDLPPFSLSRQVEKFSQETEQSQWKQNKCILNANRLSNAINDFEFSTFFDCFDFYWSNSLDFIFLQTCKDVFNEFISSPE